MRRLFCGKWFAGDKFLTLRETVTDSEIQSLQVLQSYGMTEFVSNAMELCTNHVGVLLRVTALGMGNTTYRVLSCRWQEKMYILSLLLKIFFFT